MAFVGRQFGFEELNPALSPTVGQPRFSEAMLYFLAKLP
jgi:hypothetical protein